VNDALLDRLAEIVGVAAVIRDPAMMESYLVDWRGVFRGDALAVVRPANTGEVAAVVEVCDEAGISIVPQGGNTGLSAGATPIGLDSAIVLNLSRMHAIRSVDARGFTMCVEAGCVLSDVQRAAEEEGRFFPLSLAAEESAQIGGLIATNAGGTAVLRYGTMRSLVLGLEVVLPDGTIADGLRALRKDNAGYDWKQLFIGSEGTLGIVTAAVLRLFPKPRHTITALLALGDVERALDAFSRLQESLGETLVGCELFGERAMELRLEQQPNLERPLDKAEWYLLVEAASAIGGLRDAAEAALADVLEREIAENCIVAESAGQRDALWEWRESITESERRAGRSAKHDVSVPVSAVAAFITESTGVVEREYPGARVIAFGHIGDGNVHFNVLLPPDGSATSDRVNATVHGIVERYRGSITAEHGIGRYRSEQLPGHRSAAEMSLMRAVKRALDPEFLMNPGAVLHPR
jgi:FAD/FMN-containing dehydrogenase